MFSIGILFLLPPSQVDIHGNDDTLSALWVGHHGVFPIYPSFLRQGTGIPLSEGREAWHNLRRMV